MSETKTVTADQAVALTVRVRGVMDRKSSLSASECAAMQRAADRLDQAIKSDPSDLSGAFDACATAVEQAEVTLTKVAERERSTVDQNGPFLTKSQSIVGQFREEQYADYDAGQVRPGVLLAAMAFGNEIVERMNEHERKAYVSTTGPGGDFAVPGAVVARVLEAVRAQQRLIQAGAMTLPMRAESVRIPSWDTPPTAGWAAPSSALPSDGGSLKAVELHAKSVGAVASLEVELIEDSGDNLDALDAVVTNEVARAIAAAVDAAGLFGAGNNAEPLGLASVPGINTVTAVGTPTDYGFAADAVFEVENDNHECRSVIYSPRTKKTLAKLPTGISGDATQLPAPDYWQALQRLVTTAVPGDQGAGSDESSALFGDFTRVVIGYRPSQQVRIIRDPFTNAAERLVRLVLWQRADIATTDPTALCVASGITAS